MSLSRRIRWTAVAGLVGVMSVSVGAAKFTKNSVADLDATPARAAEVGRLRAHFDSVLSELATHDLHALGAAQRANRAMLVAELTRYRSRGAFPHNYDFPGQSVPYFVDRKTGTPQRRAPTLLSRSAEASATSSIASRSGTTTCG